MLTLEVLSFASFKQWKMRIFRQNRLILTFVNFLSSKRFLDISVKMRLADFLCHPSFRIHCYYLMSAKAIQIKLHILTAQMICVPSGFTLGCNTKT